MCFLYVVSIASVLIDWVLVLRQDRSINRTVIYFFPVTVGCVFLRSYFYTNGLQHRSFFINPLQTTNTGTSPSCSNLLSSTVMYYPLNSSLMIDIFNHHLPPPRRLVWDLCVCQLAELIQKTLSTNFDDMEGETCDYSNNTGQILVVIQMTLRIDTEIFKECFTIAINEQWWADSQSELCDLDQDLCSPTASILVLLLIVLFVFVYIVYRATHNGMHMTSNDLEKRDMKIKFFWLNSIITLERPNLAWTSEG